MDLARGIRHGAAAGAAATATLNAVTYLDMAIRGRPASSTPEQSVEELSHRVGVPIPGQGDRRDNRVAGLAPLLGTAAGVGAGMALGMLRATGAVSGRRSTTAAAFVAAMIVGNGPMTLLRITDPRQWSAADWVADVVPHAAYALVAGAVLDDLDDLDD